MLEGVGAGGGGGGRGRRTTTLVSEALCFTLIIIHGGIARKHSHFTGSGGQCKDLSGRTCQMGRCW